MRPFLTKSSVPQCRHLISMYYFIMTKQYNQKKILVNGFGPAPKISGDCLSYLTDMLIISWLSCCLHARLFCFVLFEIGSRLNTPAFVHCWNLRWQIWCGGYRSDKSFHCAPVRSTHKMPFNTSRGSRGLRSREFFLHNDCKIIGSSLVHCLSVRFHTATLTNLMVLF